ncbi:hypothetical protein W97_05436 [Coniosporium apollinis CBS 100218]|uniref:Uncharacterized protein n=1 Tax=Coniosporium apollinis (strain CBS 100218) TaxID=1168221 RepID=R7YX02_CONA1|nr:uncharacterized protein W97_05436 [Coniosporium apollinis CBS 100218]EON66339.1 hypothetical protein W97_05436 [Coniosporium apollinis CBS 100218]
MKFSATTIVAFAGLAAAAPTKRQSGPTDADILNYALTLEHLEDTFYREGLANFTQADFEAAGYDETFYGNLKRISSDESTHVSFLTGALKAAGATPVEACQYAFGVTDVNTFLVTASVLEGVGVSAYLGAAADIMSKTYLTAAGSILTVEARHSSYIRASLKQTPYPQPFDTPLSINSVYTLAAQFIISCPSTNPALPVKAFPVLAASSSDMSIKKGSTVMLSTPGYMLKAENDAPVYGAFITVTGPIIVNATMVEGGYEVVVPEGVNGQSYVVLTGCADAVNDNTVAAGPAIVEAS